MFQRYTLSNRVMDAFPRFCKYTSCSILRLNNHGASKSGSFALRAWFITHITNVPVHPSLPSEFYCTAPTDLVYPESLIQVVERNKETLPSLFSFLSTILINYIP